jgi:hypothetical protein
MLPLAVQALAADLPDHHRDPACARACLITQRRAASLWLHWPIWMAVKSRSGLLYSKLRCHPKQRETSDAAY